MTRHVLGDSGYHVDVGSVDSSFEPWAWMLRVGVSTLHAYFTWQNSLTLMTCTAAFKIAISHHLFSMQVVKRNYSFSKRHRV